MEQKTIELNRRFTTVEGASGNKGNRGYRRRSFYEDRGWDELLEHPYVVVLGEAGTGKTTEFRSRATQLMASGSPAFFLELVKLARDGLDGLDPEDDDRLEDWKTSETPAVFFLDSLDEAKLRQETLGTALTKLRRKLRANWRNVRLVISCRASDWQAAGDRAAVEAMIPKEESQPVGSDGSSPSSNNEALIVAELKPLDNERVRLLTGLEGVEDVDALLDAIHQANAESFVERPLDVRWLAKHWKQHGQIGTLTELLQSNIAEKLMEDPERRSGVSVARAREVASALASACVLERQVSLWIPNERRPHDDGSLDPSKYAIDVGDRELQEVFSRAIFDEASYGRARFHHRSVQEFLAAEWLLKLLRCGLSRRALHALVFHQGDDGLVVPSHLAPTVAWLSLVDEKIRQKAISLNPALLIQHGDPSGISVSERLQILKRYAQSYADRTRRFDSFATSSLARFASEELSDAVSGLLNTSETPEELRIVLLEMIAAGKMAGPLHDALRIARNDDGRWTNRERFWAVFAIGRVQEPEICEALSSLSEGESAWEPGLAGAFLRALYPGHLGVDGVVRVLENTATPAEFVATTLDSVLDRDLRDRSKPEQLHELALKIFALVQPSERADKEAESSRTRQWLLPTVVRLMASYLSSLSEGDTVSVELLRILDWVCFRDPVYDDVRHGTDDLRSALGQVVSVRRQLFWHVVDRVEEPLIAGHYGLFIRGDLFHLAKEDGAWLFEDIESRRGRPERLVALEAALRLLGAADPRFDEISTSDPEAAERLRIARTPYTREDDPVFAAHEQEMAKIQLKRDSDWQESLRRLRKDLVAIREGRQVNALCFVFANLQGAGDRNYSDVIGKQIREKFGDDIAEAVEQGWQRYWRGHQPPLPARNSTPYTAIIGLIGLGLEVSRGLDLATLSVEDACRATRYATSELNGFPDWLETLAALRPDDVRIALEEALHADFSYRGPGPVLDVLYKIPGAAPSVRRAVTPVLQSLLLAGDPPRFEALRESLEVLLAEDSDGAANSLDGLYADRCDAAVDRPSHFSVWWMVWLARDWSTAIDHLEQRLSGLETGAAAALIEVLFHHLREDADRYGRIPLTVKNEEAALARLIPIAFQHVDSLRDVHHTGVYSPGSRDNAQDMRDRFLSWLTALNTKESVRALKDLASNEVMVAHRDYLLAQAERTASSAASSEENEIATKLLALCRVYGTRVGENLGDLHGDVMDRIDVGFITIRKDEFSALCDAVNPTCHVVDGNRRYEIAEVSTQNGLCRVAVMQTVNQGNRVSQGAATDMIASLQPKFVVVFGIGGGVPTTDYCLGDVIVASHVMDLSVEDTGTEPSQQRFDAEGFQLHVRANRVMTSVAAVERRAARKWNVGDHIVVPRPGLSNSPTRPDDEDWNAKISKAIEAHANRTDPLVDCRKSASSDRLMKSSEIVRQWQQDVKGICSIEMEAAGVFYACHRKDVPALAVRGISDVVGLERDNAWLAYSLSSAASLVRMLIEEGVFLENS